MTTQKAPTKLEAEAMALFGVKTTDGIRSVLYAIGLRQACGRCGGSGHYSRNAMGDTRCYDCKGRKSFAAKLTRSVLEQARVKVEAGELDACRARVKAQREAKAMVAPKVAAGEAIYREIADAYTAGSRAIDRAVDHDAYKAQLHAFVDGPLFRANSVNNDLFHGECSSHAFRRDPARGMRAVQRDVDAGRIDAVRACAELDELLSMLTELRDAWRAWERAAPAHLRSAAHARLAA